MNTIDEIIQNIHYEKEFIYRGQNAKFTGISCNNGQCRIDIIIGVKPQTIIKESGDKLSLFLLNFKIKPEKESKPETQNNSETNIPATNHPGPVFLQKREDTFLRIADMLLEDIEKVRSDKEYIPQAKQAANSAQAIVNVTKLQLDILKNA